MASGFRVALDTHPTATALPEGICLVCGKETGQKVVLTMTLFHCHSFLFWLRRFRAVLIPYLLFFVVYVPVFMFLRTVRLDVALIAAVAYGAVGLVIGTGLFAWYSAKDNRDTESFDLTVAWCPRCRSASAKRTTVLFFGGWLGMLCGLGLIVARGLFSWSVRDSVVTVGAIVFGVGLVSLALALILPGKRPACDLRKVDGRYVWRFSEEGLAQQVRRRNNGCQNGCQDQRL